MQICQMMHYYVTSLLCYMVLGIYYFIISFGISILTTFAISVLYLCSYFHIFRIYVYLNWMILLPVKCCVTFYFLLIILPDVCSIIFFVMVTNNLFQIGQINVIDPCSKANKSNKCKLKRSLDNQMRDGRTETWIDLKLVSNCCRI